MVKFSGSPIFNDITDYTHGGQSVSTRLFNLHPDFSRVLLDPDFSRVLSEIFVRVASARFFSGWQLEKSWVSYL